MTTARTADLYTEVVATPTTVARTADLYAEVVATSDVAARVADLYIEIIVGGPAGGWSIGSLRVG